MIPNKWAFLIGLLCLGLSVAAPAATSGKLIGMTGMINIASSRMGEGIDTDALILFQDMQVPVQESMLGPGKSIVTKDRALNFICAEKGSSGNPACTIMINRGANSILSKGRIGFRVKGAQAQELSSLFRLDGRGLYTFKSIDGVLRVYATADDFYVLWDETGVP